MTDSWNERAVRVGMPHMSPGGKLSEVELFKLMGDLQWQSIGKLLGQSTREITNEFEERLYASFIEIELCLGDRHSLESFGEGSDLFLRNRVLVYAKRFIQGICAIDDREIPDDQLQEIKTTAELASLGVSWASVTNAFVAQAGSNQKLTVFKPAGIDDLELPELSDVPVGIVNHAGVQRTSEIEALEGSEPSRLLVPTCVDRIAYTVLPESDLNGAGLLYFARYLAILNYGERIFLAERLDRPVSRALHACLSTEHRRIFYFANADAGERIEITVRASLLRPESFTSPRRSRYRTPFKLVVRSDLYRGSDGLLMASSLVRKALRVPGDAKPVLAEAERLLKAFG